VFQEINQSPFPTFDRSSNEHQCHPPSAETSSSALGNLRTKPHRTLKELMAWLKLLVIVSMWRRHLSGHSKGNDRFGNAVDDNDQKVLNLSRIRLQ
jgi:hypothetical protein